MAAPARQRAVYTAKEALEIVQQSGSDDEGEEGDVVQHDEENEDELFEDARKIKIKIEAASSVTQ